MTKPSSTSQRRTEGRGLVYDSIIDTIGNTPLVRLSRLQNDAGVKAEILAKLEFFNPLASVTVIPLRPRS